MTVFILVHEWIVDGCDGGVQVTAYSSKDKALKALKEEIKSAKLDFSDLDNDLIIEDNVKNKLSWACYEDNYYNTNHAMLYVEESTVQ